MLEVLKTFYKFLFKKKFWAIIFIVLIIISPVLESITPYFYKLFVDAIPSFDSNLIVKILLTYLVVKIFAMIIDLAKMQVGDILSIDAGADTMKTIFSHVHKLDFAYHTSKSSGALISAFKRGDGAFWNFYFAIHFRIIEVVIRFFVLLYFFKNLNTQIFLMIIATFAASLLVIGIFVKFNVRARKKVNEKEDEISGVIVDNMINFETVKLFAKEDWEQKRLEEHQSTWKRAVWKYIYTWRGFDLGMGIVINASIFMILLYSLQMTINKSFTIGDFVLVTAFLQSFFPHLYDLVFGLRDIAKRLMFLPNIFTSSNSMSKQKFLFAYEML